MCCFSHSAKGRFKQEKQHGRFRKNIYFDREHILQIPIILCSVSLYFPYHTAEANKYALPSIGVNSYKEIWMVKISSFQIIFLPEYSGIMEQ